MKPRPGGWGANGWATSAAAAGVAWLGCLCVAAVCLLAPKLQYPAFARGADPIEMFTAVVVTALGILRVPIDIGGLTISVLPLGALTAVAVAIGSAAAGTSARPLPIRSAIAAAGRMATIFGGAAFVMALVFRIPGRDSVSASPVWALVMAFLWCICFAAAGLRLPPRWWVDAFVSRLAAFWRGDSDRAGLWGGLAMASTAVALAAAALLIWVIASLVRGSPLPQFGWGDAAAAAVFLAAFLPNICVAVVALSLGAPILRGAQIGIGGETVGRLREVSLLTRPDDASTAAYLLVLIPVVSCTLGGWLLARAQETRGKVWRQLLISALTFAGVFCLLAWLGDARIGAGLVKDRGFARVAVQPWPTFGWGMLWALVFGWFGCELALRRSKG